MKKRFLALMAGLAMLLCAAPVFADEAWVTVPYAQNGNGWWSGLALVNQSGEDLDVTIYRTDIGSGPWKIVYQGVVPARGMDTKLLPEFFKLLPYPTENGGRVSLNINAVGPKAKQHFRVVLFTGGPDGGFGFESYDHDD
ncbi:hypothetical protein [Desulfomicrobium orale]|uniref:Sensory rhodopsin transducer n=1 Tax=Desulfomicrobium orale DSM 12838 TaxID=888061 RepID=A0A109W6G5_9BACT|nr:hypothetical protein [Desulfomicrobium orale]AMD93605.1 hypothetical protein AXF15_11165 [Desulfomicrobium orale DSM 12838]